MKKIITILFLSLFIFQTVSIGVISIFFSESITIKQVNSSTACNEEDISKDFKKYNLTETEHNALFLLSDLFQDNKAGDNRKDFFIANQYFEITVPPPNCLS